MMRDFYQQFTIHPVGQGLFYSGIISFRNQTKFRMVFDCGSLTGGAAAEEVSLYRDRDFLAEKQLDLLVISHFDADHVNHIGKLLAGGIKVKKLVMPFLTFRERLFLVMQYIDGGDALPGDDFTLELLLDPLSALGDNLDDDSEIYFVESSPRPPDGPPDEAEGSGEPNPEGNDIVKRFDFTFENAKPAESNAYILKSGKDKRLFTVPDSEKGNVMAAGLKLMDFLFYRRSIGAKEKEFYDEVATLFHAAHKIDPSLSDQDNLEAIVAEVKQIKSATKIKEIFGKAKKTAGVLGINLKDLNTTALCLLHRNLKGIFVLSGIAYDDDYPWFYYNDFDVFTIHKFDSASRLETHCEAAQHWRYREIPRSGHSIFPNVLLTSDSFLLHEAQLDPFLAHYKSHWAHFWLFQVPHHGSENNGDDKLFSHIGAVSNCFINYGIGNRDEHPSASVIHALVTTGNSAKVLPVNQISGLQFSVRI